MILLGSKFGNVQGLILNTILFTKHENFNCYSIKDTILSVINNIFYIR